MNISSLTNAYIKDLVRLQKKKGRDESNAFLIEGEHLVEEAKRANLNLKTLGLSGCDITITEHIAEKLSTTRSGSTIFARVEKKTARLEKGRRYLLCDGVQDPGNMGTMIRTAHSFGFDALILSEDCVDEYNDKVVRSTQGSLFHIPVIRMNLIDAIQTLKSFDVVVYASALKDSSVALSEIKDEALAVVMGSEGAGVSAEIMNACDHLMKIETSQFESLNVAVASAIICYTLRTGK